MPTFANTFAVRMAFPRATADFLEQRSRLYFKGIQLCFAEIVKNGKTGFKSLRSLHFHLQALT
jgi:hypothetical protein